MIKRMMIKLAIAVGMMLGVSTFVVAGNVFEIRGTDGAGEVLVETCLHVDASGQGITCERHRINALNLDVRTTLSDRRYETAGIRLWTAENTFKFPGSNCSTMRGNYCVFPVSNAVPRRIGIKKTATYPVGGSILGLTAEGLVLQINDGVELAVRANASSFQFEERFIYDTRYEVGIKTQPTGQRCTISHATGVVRGKISTVAINCVDLTLYASTGAGSDVNPNSLYTMETTGPNAGLGTFVMSMTDSDGAVIAADSEKLYHWTGYDPLKAFESIDVDTRTLTSIPFYGDSISEVFGAVFYRGAFRVSSIDDVFYRFTTDGAVTQIRENIGTRRGFACYGGRIYAVTPGSNDLYELDPASGETVSAKKMTLAGGGVVDKALAITANPNTGEICALLKMKGDSKRKLVSVNTDTGVATLVADARGETGDEKFASLAFFPADANC
ncbi:MAG: hypothetical protein K0U37_02955 [Gammaproteobacteria bacterium]|nr:hypothetical protein [Gammaproteobacteria bacterium]